MRLSLALDAGLEIPDGPVVIRHPTLETDLSAFPEALVETPDFLVAQVLGAAGRVLEDDIARYAATVVIAPRSKDLARDLIALAAATTDGPIIVDGQKTDGIDSLYKACRSRADVQGTVTKAHGRCFWMQADADAFGDWQWSQPDVHGFALAPGVFSADGIDPGSYALAEVLPEKMQGRVADLGAGWGYLSAVALARGVDHVDLVDTNAMALACAQANVTRIDGGSASCHWDDATNWTPSDAPDHVIMNPPFHQGRKGTPDLGAAFIRNAARILAGRGTLWMVANRHLPYEDVLNTCFGHVVELEGPPGTQGFKLFQATKPQGQNLGRRAKSASPRTVHRTRR